jgi:hypothetical protein
VCGHHVAPRTLWATRSAKAFIGPPRSLMPTRSCALARGANFMHVRPISRLMPYRPYPSHGRLPCGGWTSSGPCEKRPGATPTYWLLWTNSPSGSRHAQSQTSGQSRP